jgi:sulfite reductase alpha subunit-like flavoprotein/pyruvate/2-oxoacid:ferredoxin oxidoreductase beta subunit/ferredoxin
MESGTCEFEKRGIAPEIPVWIGDTCTQCNYCAIVCPHAVVRPFLLDKAEAKAAPADFEMRKAQGGAETAGYQYTIQLASMDCTGCAVCVQSCPDDSLYMAPYTQVAETQIPHWEYAFSLPNKHDLVDKYSVKGSQFQQPLMEFSGACAGCGETPYVKLLTQLFGERLMIANASGCSSVWGGTATTNPYTRNKESGRGPAWGRSLFEDNAEYGFGMLLGRRQRRLQVAGLATDVLEDSSMQLPDDLRATLSQWVQYQNHPDKSVELADSLASSLADARASNPKLDQLYQMRDMMPYSSQWIIGGDGWAYDIGYGGVDWVLSRGENVNILVLDTEMYSNTGGQLSGATPQAAQIKFASAGKPNSKKDLGQLAMMYGNVYVASIAMGADYAQSLKAIKEAEEYDGPSLIIAYSPCIDWGLDMKYMMDVQKTAVDSGYWTLYRYDPRNTEQGKNPFQLDSKRIKIDMEKLLSKENRFRNLKRTQKDRADVLQEQLKARSKNRHSKFKRMSLDDEELLETLKEQIGESTGEKMTILYASETGNTEALALQLQYEMKRRDVKAKCMAFDDLDIADLPKQNVVINLAATCGQGEYPANSRMFWDAINDPELPSDFLANTRFATFAMGDSHYVYFNEVGKRIDERFAELGGQRIQEIGMGDDQEEDKWETQWIDWEPNLFGELGTMEPPKELMDATHIIRPNEAHEPVRPSIVPPGATVVPLTTNVMITPGGRDNRHYEFDLKGTNVNYSCGDSLGVYPHNDPKMVEEFLDTLNLKMDTVLECNDLSGARKPPLPEKVTAGQLFTEVLDIFGKPKRQFYDVLSMAVTDEKERQTLEYWMSKEGKDDFRSNCTDETVTYADLLQMFPSAMPKFDLAYMIDFISPIKPRLYSIASAQETVGEEVHLCIVENDWDTPKGKFQRGACTSYLMRQDPAMNPQVAVRVNPAAIAMPSSQKTPMIMCGLGTGYAPFRAFMQERRTMRDRDGEEVGPMALYFGARHKATEFLYGCGDTEYANEIDDFQKDGILTELVCAFSRDQEKKVYVQNRMQENYEMLYEYLVEKEGFFYLCGPSGPVVPVRQAVVDSLVHVGKRTPEEAEAYVTNMQITGRYNVEVW